MVSDLVAAGTWPSAARVDNRSVEGEPNRELTFLMTDVEGSTRLWDASPEAMSRAMKLHDALIAEVAVGHDGSLIKARGEGDSAFIVFADAAAAVRCAAALQRRIRSASWPPVTPIRVRMALHTGIAEGRDGDYYGEVVNRCSRVRAAGHGGQVLLTDRTCAATAPALGGTLGAVSLGDFRLRDLTRPERIWQLTHPDLESSFPPLQTQATPRHNLPRELSSFIGREADIATALAAVRRAPLVTLSGPGGVGKTRLAERVAAAMLTEMNGGSWLVDLAPLDDAADVLPAIAAVLDVAADSRASMETAVAARMQTTAILLVLDNCEHLMPALGEVVAGVVAAAGDSRILATSRQPLGVQGEAVVTVAPLVTPAAGTTGATHSDAVMLFCDRMRSHGASVPTDDARLHTVAAICQRVDGLPLAIEFAAARTRALTPEELLSRLDRQLPLLRGDRRTRAGGRQQTLEAAIDWSYRLLDETEQRALNRMAVFQGGFTFTAAAAVAADVCSEAGCIDVIASLVDKSLVTVQDRSGSMRYRLLGSIGEFAMQRLVEEGELVAARTRHVVYFTALAHELASGLADHRRSTSLARLRREWRNILVALGWTLKEGGPAALGVELAAAVGSAWSSSAQMEDAKRWLETAVAAATTAPPAVRRDLAAALASVAFYSGDTRGMIRWQEDAVRHAREAEDPRALGRTLADLALRHSAVRATTTATAVMEEAGELVRRFGDAVQVNFADFVLGRIALMSGDLDAADALLADVMQRDITSRLRAVVTMFRGWERALLGDESAVQLSSDALAAAEETGDPVQLINVLETCAIIDVLLGRAPEAQTALVRVIAELAEVGRWTDRVRALMAATLLAALVEDWPACAQLSGATGDPGTGVDWQPQTEVRYRDAVAAARTALGDRDFERCAVRGVALTAAEITGVVAGLGCAKHRRPQA